MAALLATSGVPGCLLAAEIPFATYQARLSRASASSVRCDTRPHHHTFTFTSALRPSSSRDK